MNLSCCAVIIQASERESKVVEVRRKKTDKLIDIFIRSKKALYVARLDRILRPPARSRAIDTLWNLVMLKNLGDHIARINNNIVFESQSRRISTRDSTLMPELILTGKGSTSPSCHLSLSPNIWLRCGSSWVEALAKTEVGNLTWTRTYGLGDKIRVGLRTAVLASSTNPSIPPGLPFDTQGFALSEDLNLHLSVERPNTPEDTQPSGCGLLCAVTIARGDRIVHNGFSRIGGILSIRDASGAVTLVGVTSGHALLDEFLTTDMESPDSRSNRLARSVRKLFRRRGRCRATESSGRDSKAPSVGESSTSSSWTRVSLSRTSSTQPSTGSVATERIQRQQWDSVQGIYSMNWLGGGWETVKPLRPPSPVPQPDMAAPSADFALLELPHDFCNTFSKGAGTATHVKEFLLEGDMREGELHIVLGPGEVVPGVLLSERPSIFLRGRLFPTRKIQLERSLNLGVSGSWVVQGDRLCGMIAMIYEDEPFAYMITAEKLMSDIKKTLGDKVEVSLPSHATLDTPLGTPDSQSSTIDRITDKLTKALVQSPMDKTKYFIPRGELGNILTLSSVRSCLQSLLPKARNIEDLATYASGNANKIFAVLLLMGKAQFLAKFLQEQIFNDDLPLQRSSRDSAEFRLVRKHVVENGHSGTSDAAVKLFDGWKSAEIRQFDDYQWFMLAPFFDVRDNGKTFFYAFHERTILPFTHYESSHREGGFSSIYKARIHPAHHELREITGTNLVALKRLAATNHEHFLKEIQAYERIRAHPHLTKLLATYTFRSRYYLVLPWAEEGSLVDVWTTRPRPPSLDRKAPLWFLQQCRGVAEALANIHHMRCEPEIPESAKEPQILIEPDAKPRDALERSQKVFGRHGDIKPANILFFSGSNGDDNGIGTLKIADFGLTSFHRDQTVSRPNRATGAWCPTYSAPECRIESQPSHLWDIWSLGCIYIEFVTWFLLGPGAIKEFTQVRSMNEPGWRTSEDNFFILSRQQGEVLQAKVKPAVTQWFRHLRNQPRCPAILADFLDYTENSILVADPGQRSLAIEVVKFLEDLYTKVAEDASGHELWGPQEAGTYPYPAFMLPLNGSNAAVERSLQSGQTNEQAAGEVRSRATRGGRPLVGASSSKQAATVSPVSASSNSPSAYEQTEPAHIITTKEYIEKVTKDRRVHRRR
ncbi:hypothetical protein RB595_007046 [Gaeumannomyces hyphopodioides]